MGFRSTSWPGISVKGQIRGSTSARLRAVRDGSRRMRPPRFLPTGPRGGAHVRPRHHSYPIYVRYIATESKQSSPTQSAAFLLSADDYPLQSGRSAPDSSAAAADRDLSRCRRSGRRQDDDRTRGLQRLSRTAASGIDRAIRLSTAAAVLAVAGIAAYVFLLARLRGRPGPRRERNHRSVRAGHRSTASSIASSMVILYAARHRAPVPWLARWLLGLGIAATLTANMAQGWSHGPVGAAVAAWPAVSLLQAPMNSWSRLDPHLRGTGTRATDRAPAKMRRAAPRRARRQPRR